MDIELSQFQDAAQLLKGKILRTSLVPLYRIQGPQGHTILQKIESLQPTGSFKVRGATYCISRMPAEFRKKGVIAYSTGNHAQAVAWAAKQVGVKATIIMSPDAPAFKIEATQSLGATVIMVEPSSELRRKKAEELAQSEHYFLVPPFDHVDVITGQGTTGLEILEDVDPAAVFVAVGGGGLISGIAMAIKKSRPGIKIIGVEPELENDAYQSFQTGKRESLSKASDSLADAIKMQTLGDLTYPLMKTYVDEMVTVSEKQIVEATLMHAERGRLIVEPAGSLPLAAVLAYKSSLPSGKPIVCVVSGGNTSLANLNAIKKLSFEDLSISIKPSLA